MTAVSLPTLAGLASMLPVDDQAAPRNVGANWTLSAYTVPLGRVLAVDWAMLQSDGGLLPDRLEIRVLDTGAATSAFLRYETPSATQASVVVDNTVWLPEDFRLYFAIGGGDAATDIIWSFSGRLFDWADVS